MTALKNIRDIEDLDIISLGDIPKTPKSQWHYDKWFKIERNLIDQGIAPSLSAHLLYEYQFNNKSITQLSKSFGFSTKRSVGTIMHKMNIPIRNNSEAHTGENHRNYGKHIPEETKRKMSSARKEFWQIRKKSGVKNKKANRTYETGENHPGYGKCRSVDTKEKISMALSTPENLERLRQAGIQTSDKKRKQKYHVENRFYADSMQEGAIVILFEKNIPGYRVAEGSTFQVRDRGIKNGGIDFLVNGEFLEWHPILEWYDEKDETTRKMYKALDAEAKTKEDRCTFNQWRREHNNELAVEYWMKRQGDVDDSGYAGANVELVRNERELYDFMERHGAEVSYGDFRKEFAAAKEKVRGYKVKKDSD
ncbi:hypothetical protein HOA55_01940 [archaeon]|jgi:hypothetical protein|nr:hypothetical protein [Chloroflexota bacterium]MBT3577283.1 hypothetical protein [archaeon]MBT6820092.1 hypothetical protein [archaeon]MBT6956658.1 hypothetical protein [archaeon]MBT7239357.1 hypothetical protein [archaeon]